MDQAPPVIASFIFYSICNLVCYKAIKGPRYVPEKEYRDYFGLHVSIVHSVLAVIATFATYIYEGGIHYNEPTNLLHIWVVGHSVGYFIYDMIYGEYYQINDMAMRVHHIGALITTGLMTFAPIGGSACAFGIFFTEISNPCILKRNILRIKKLMHTSAYNFYETAFGIVFIIARVVVATWYLYNLWSSVGWLAIKLGSSAVYGVSLFWVFIILLKIVKRLNATDTRLDYVFATILDGMIWLKKNQAVLIGLFVLWAVGLPYLVCYVMERPIIYLAVNNFNIL
jgi:hypothetical protein